MIKSQNKQNPSCFEFGGLRLVALLLALAASAMSVSASAQANLYWGDIHLHTNFSLDAYGVGNTSAFYYVRVIEIPTPRQSLFDAVALGIDVSVTNYSATLQERAYSSPIWYTP